MRAALTTMLRQLYARPRFPSGGERPQSTGISRVASAEVLHARLSAAPMSAQLRSVLRNDIAALTGQRLDAAALAREVHQMMQRLHGVAWSGAEMDAAGRQLILVVAPDSCLAMRAYLVLKRRLAHE